MPPRWEWPAWCLNFKSPNIEVWVLDDETNIGRWVSAQPQSRVVDKSGKDAYLCAEYNWDGEYYVQDFGPQHVRRNGERATVMQLLGQADRSSVEMDSTKVFKGNDLDQTKVFEKNEKLIDTKVFGSKKKGGGRDLGGGLSSFLED